MKKWLAFLMTLAMLVAMLAGCVTVNTTDSDDDDTQPSAGSTQPSGTSAPTTTPTTAPTTAPTGSGDPSTAPTQSSGATDPTQPSGATDPTQPSQPVAQKDPSAEISFSGDCMEFTWTDLGNNRGYIAAASVVRADAEQMGQMGLTGTLTVKHEIRTYEVTYTKEAQGVYVAEGAIISAAASVEGESAAAFIEMMKANLGSSKLDELTKRTLDGEVLTKKDDIENFIWMFDCTLKLTFTVENGKLVVRECEQNYINWGFLEQKKEIYRITDNVIRVYEEYTKGEIECIFYYRTSGVIEKADYYYEGKISYTTFYDEAGNPIQDTENKDNWG